MPGWATRSRRASDQPLTADELHLLRWGLGGVLALVAVWGTFFFELSGRELLAPVTVVLLAALRWPRLSGQLPAVVWRLVVPGLMLFVAADLVLNAEPLAAMLRLNVLLIAVRAAGPRRPREDLQLVVLGLFLVVVAGVLTVAIGFALHILIFTALALPFLLTITLSGASGPETEPDGWLQVGWRRLLGRLWRQTDWRVVGAATALYLLVVAMASVLFVAMPRFQIENSLGFLQLKNRHSRSGFSETVKLGEVTEISLDTSTALRAEVSDPAQAPALPYWRMLALDEYREGTFRISRGLGRLDHDLGEGREVLGRREPAPPGPMWTFYLEAGVSRYLPIPGDFHVMRLRESRAVKDNPAAATLALRTEPQSMFAYRMEGLDFAGVRTDHALRAALVAAVPGGAADYPLTLLEVPAGEANAKVLDAILAEITGGGQPAAELAPRIIEYLGRRHRYSMTSALPGGAEDPLVRWLAGTTPGHCELFAGGFALVARRAGFPVRVVTGFKGGAWNAFEHYYMVRNSDAHAWCELLDEGGHWVRVDPTPGASAEAAGTSGPAAEVDSSWTARLDALRMLWYRRIVSFDQKAQDEVVNALKSTTRRTARELVEWMDRHGRALRNWLLRPWDFGRIIAWAGMLAGGGTTIWLLWRWRQLWWLSWLRRGKMDPVRREAGRWLRRLASAELTGVERRLWLELERLRYGPAERRGGAPAVFRQARRMWRRRG